MTAVYGFNKYVVADKGNDLFKTLAPNFMYKINMKEAENNNIKGVHKSINIKIWWFNCKIRYQFEYAYSDRICFILGRNLCQTKTYRLEAISK